MIRTFLREVRRSIPHVEHRKRKREGGAIIKVTKIMPITLMNDAQYRLPAAYAELKTELIHTDIANYVSTLESLSKKKKRERERSAAHEDHITV